MKRVLSLSVLVVTIAGCAGGLTYVKDGITQAEADRDLRLCKAWASGGVPLYRPTPSYKHEFSTPYGNVSGTSRPDRLTAFNDLLFAAALIQEKQNLVGACMEHNGYRKVYGQRQVSSPCTSKMSVQSMLAEYYGYPDYKAIAKTPSGSVYGWSCGGSSQEQAKEMAMGSCQKMSREPCELHAIGNTLCVSGGQCGVE